MLVNGSFRKQRVYETSSATPGAQHNPIYYCVIKMCYQVTYFIIDRVVEDLPEDQCHRIFFPNGESNREMLK